MPAPPTLFIFVTAAGVAPSAAALVRGAVAAGWQTYVVATPNVAMVTPAESLYSVPGAHAIRDYGAEAPLDTFPAGTMLVAPCTFNTLNKLAHGLADTLVTAMVADALGAGCPVFVAPAMNHGLWHHPQTRLSLDRLATWGCTIIPPVVEGEQVRMASVATILDRLHAHFGHG
jgi:3-polyprenyl-4-hydroxybenzoate decarboxylase